MVCLMALFNEKQWVYYDILFHGTQHKEQLLGVSVHEGAVSGIPIKQNLIACSWSNKTDIG